MELHINTEKYSYLKCVYNGRLVSDESIEMIVPDALPDIYEIIDTKADCLLKGKDSDNGSIAISATVVGSVIYTPDGDTLPKRMEFSIPVSFTAADGNIHSDSSIVAVTAVKSAEARILNPRKISIKICAVSETVCYEKSDADIPKEIGSGDAKTQFLSKEFSLKTPSDVSEKLYVVSDELKISASKPAIEDILFTDFSIITDDVKTVGTKAVCNGIIKSTIVYTSLEAPGIYTVNGETQFSQIIEMNSLCDNCIAEIRSSATGIYLNSDLIASSNDRSVNFEVHIVSQCIVYSDMCFTAVCDAYSPVYELAVNSGSLKIKSINDISIVNDTAKVSMASAGAAEIVSSFVNISSFSEENNGANASLTCNGTVHVLYADDGGGVHCVKEHFKQTTHTTVPFVNLGNVNLCSDISVNPILVQGSIEAKISFGYKIESVNFAEIPMIHEITYNEAMPIDTSEYPSVIIRRICDGDNLWTLSKKYNSSKELILRINKAETEEEILGRGFMLIPKYR